LRQVTKPVFYAVNKVDGPKQEAGALEFYELGVDTVFPISAQHGQGIYEFMDAVAAHLPPPSIPRRTTRGRKPPRSVSLSSANPTWANPLS
jgi:predicted GTPase